MAQPASVTSQGSTDMSQQENYNEAATRSQETFLLALIKILFDNWAFVGFDVTSVNRHESAKDLQRSNDVVTSIK